MKTLAPRLLAAAALAALSACTSFGADARYDQSLARWKGASSAQLVAAWGRPASTETMQGTARAMSWVVHHDLENAGVVQPVIVSSVSGNVVTQPGIPMTPVVPATCRTRFVLVDDKVVSWTFDGIACGAPQ